jgi:hypothetical protein
LNGPDAIQFREDGSTLVEGPGYVADVRTWRNLARFFRAAGEAENAARVEAMGAKGGPVIGLYDPIGADLYVTRHVTMTKGGSA